MPINSIKYLAWFSPVINTITNGAPVTIDVESKHVLMNAAEHVPAKKKRPNRAAFDFKSITFVSWFDLGILQR